MSHPPGWAVDEPCASCGSWDITEYEIRIGADAVSMGWECRDCRHVASWRPGSEGR